MQTTRKAAILKFATTAYEMGLETFQGVVRRAEDGTWLVGQRSLEAWLEAHAGEEIVMALGSLADDRPVVTRTCRTCGRDYTELECPTCRANRIRLRGRP